MTTKPSPEDFTCPLPLRDYPNIVLGHGGGGQLSGELVEHLFLPQFQNDQLAHLGDSTVLEIGGQRLAFSTDSFVVRPLFFPGGSIGELAVHGTVNDLAMSGAEPLYLSASFILEEGLPIDTLQEITARMAAAARQAGVTIVTGDTKVVEKGHGDGCYINTAGIGLVPPGIEIGPERAQPGDVVLVSGTLGDHGMAIMSAREGLQFESTIQSDSAPLGGLVREMLAVCPKIHVLRDPTRGGLAASLNEIATQSGTGFEVEETRIPVDPIVAAACEILGLDPLMVANEGKLLAIVPPDYAESLLDTMRHNPLGKQAAKIGHVTESHPRMVVAKTAIGGTRVITTQIGEQLPRIC